MSKFKPRGYSINDFLSWNDRSELELQPRFQRREVWSDKAKSNLIDTIFRDLPIPIIFVRQKVDPKKRRTSREVVDGQQRLRAMISFAKDEFAILKSQNPSLGGSTFGRLSSDDQQRFLDYELSVVLLQEVSDLEVLEIFARLNTYAQKLTEQELLNAAYYGEFKKTVYSLGLEHLEFWRQNGILKDSQIMRMAEAELTTELLVVMLVGVQNRRNKIAELYESKDDSFPEKERAVREFKAIIDTITRCLGDSLKNTIFCRRVLFYSLFCAFYHVMYGIPHTKEFAKEGRFPNLTAPKLLLVKDSLITLNKKYKGTSPPPEIQKFIDASRKATGDREERIVRIKTIADCINKAIEG